MNIFRTFLLLMLVGSFAGSLSAQVDINKPINLSGAADSDRAITNLAPPVNGTDAVNKDYVDGLSGGGGSGHAVGDLFGGGIIVGLWKEGGVEKGLIASLTDLSAGVEWSANTTGLIGVSAQSRTNGQSNTNAIVAQNSTPGYAATLCDSYTNPDTGTGVFSDWYLPSIYEIHVCWQALFVVENALGEADAFQGPWYWSSTEEPDNGSPGSYAWCKYFVSTTPMLMVSKSSLGRVRAVRRF